jgi:hypothetical protein
MTGNAVKHVGEPGLRIDVIHLGRDNQTVHGGGALAAAVRSGEQPCSATTKMRRSVNQDETRQERWNAERA